MAASLNLLFIMYNFFGSITLKRIQSIISDYDIYTYYIGRKVPLSRAINSPLRSDNNPSFSLYEAGDRVRWIDFSLNEEGSVTDFVMKLFNLSFKEALMKVFQDLCYGKVENLNIKVDEKRVKSSANYIKVKVQNLTDIDNSYWGRYYVSEELLKFYNIYSCKVVFFDSNPWLYYKNTNPIYGYLFFKDGKYSWKIYRPFESKTNKFKGSVDFSILQGYTQLPESGDTLIITKALKDVVVLRRLGYYSVAPQSENILIKPSVFNELKERFTKIYTLMDNDLTGKMSTERYTSKYNTIPLMLTEAKDISDYIEKFGLERSQILMKEIIDGNISIASKN